QERALRTFKGTNPRAPAPRSPAPGAKRGLRTARSKGCGDQENIPGTDAPAVRQVEEGAFPPCIQALITALAAGTNLTHAGRFSLTAFLHNIGMDTTGIAELYARSPDFDIEKTMYQVEHITGRGGTGTEYTTPACAAMQTT